MSNRKIIDYTAVVVDDIYGEVYKNFLIYLTSNLVAQSYKNDKNNRFMLISAHQGEVKTISTWATNFHNVKQLLELLDSSPDEAPCRLIDAIRHTVNSFEESKHINKLIVVSDLKEPFKTDNMILDNIKEKCISTFVIGPEVENGSLETTEDLNSLRFLNKHSKNMVNLNDTQRDNLNILYGLLNKPIIANLKIGLSVVLAYKPKIKTPFVWYVDMDIGSDLKIKVACYNTIRKKQPFKYKYTSIIDDEKDDFEASSSKNLIEKCTNNPIEPDDVVRGYVFHKKVAVIDKDLLAEKTQKQYCKSLSIKCFCDADDMHKVYFDEYSIAVICPDRRNSSQWQTALSLLVSAMKAKNVVALAERIYNNNNKPKLYCLFVDEDDKLLMARIPYKHQLIKYYRRSKKVKDVLVKPELQNLLDNYFDDLAEGNDNELDLHLTQDPCDTYEAVGLACEAWDIIPLEIEKPETGVIYKSGVTETKNIHLLFDYVHPMQEKEK